MSATPVGTTVLDILIPEADPLVAAFRRRLDPSAAVGMPAHVTVVHPWRVFDSEVGRDDDIVVALRDLFATQPAFELVFSRTARFPDVLYLEPEPTGPVLALTRAVVQHWPEFPPYGGEYGEQPTPHLTVTRGAPTAEHDGVATELAKSLPIRSAVTSIAMHRFDGRQWRLRHEFPLGVASD